MKRILRWLIVLGVLGGVAAVAVPRGQAYWKERNRPKFKTDLVKQGSIKWEVRTTGTVQPVRKVTIGAFVSGPIEVLADYNDWVEKGQRLANVDRRIYEAAVGQSEAAWYTAQAEVERVKATLQQAINDERRALRLREINEDYLSDSEMDQFRFARQGLEAQLKVAQLSVDQAQANLDNAKLNLNYTQIDAPTSGYIIDRKIDSGQTIAVQFQTPELFVIAPEMNKRMWVHASVVEADIGHVIRAKRENRPVHFTVDAYEDKLFQGTIREIRQNPTTSQNVVTYPVIVETPNKDLMLMPGMTANLSFEIESREDVLLIPGAAIRFLPDKKLVRDEDHAVLEGTSRDQEVIGSRSASDRVTANLARRSRHLWVQEGDLLRAIPIEFGIFDGRYYELVKGDVKAGQTLVWDVEKK